MSTLPSHLFDACDTIDAAIFSGDSLHDRARFDEFKQWIERWQRAFPDIEDMIKESSPDR